MSKEEELIKIIRDSKFSEKKLEQLKNTAISLATPATYQIVNPTSNIADPAFLEAFSEELLLHHARHKEPVNKFWFEYIAIKGAQAAGKLSRKLEVNEHPPADIIIDNMLLSMKTEAAVKINPNKIHISKLQEARWIRDCKSSQDCINQIQKKLVPSLSKCDKILVLRAFREQNLIRYEIEEIPLEILLAINYLKDSDFSSPTPNNTRSSKVKLKGKEAFTLTLDGSVEKIKITNLSTYNCIKHAVFKIPV